MPKKENSKAVAAREEKASKASEKNKAAAAKQEDDFWEGAAGKKGKAQAKKENKDVEREEAAKRKSEAKRLAEQEEAEMANYGKAKAKAPPVPKVTAAERARMKEKEAKQQEEEIERKKLVMRRELGEAELARVLDKKNVNREDTDVDASGIDDAVSALERVSMLSPDAGDEDMHPERRRKAAYMAYEERMLKELKEDKPGLKIQQYKDMIFKSWKKAPDNPMNQPRVQ
eukprot:9382868-Pyramimonas_sp.AAC.3